MYRLAFFLTTVAVAAYAATGYYQDTPGGSGLEKWGDYGVATLLAGWSLKYAWDTKTQSDTTINDLKQRLADAKAENTANALAIEAKSAAEIRQMVSDAARARELLIQTMTEMKNALVVLHEEVTKMRSSKTDDLLRRVDELSQQVRGKNT